MIQHRTPLLFLALLAACIVFLPSCSFQPLAWQPPLALEYVENEALATTSWVDLDGWYGPEDIAFDAKGDMYCGVHDGKFQSGRILKIDSLGKVETFCETDAWVTGLHFDAQGMLIACDQKRGLISVNPEGEITLLTRQDNKGRKLLLPNDVDIAPDGKIYFSNTSFSDPFSARVARKIILEMRPTGGLFCYDQETGKTTTVLDSGYFANGVAVSKQGDFVLMVDMAKYRILRHWLEGNQAGQTEIFMDNLPGLPNGISRRVDGTFWLGFTTRRSKVLDKIQAHPGRKRLVYSLPKWLQPKQESYGMLMQVSETGTVLQLLTEPTGKIVSEVSSVEEHDGYLYLGGDLTDHIGKCELQR